MLANDLRSGLTVYLTEQGNWSENFEESWYLQNDSIAASAMKKAAESERNNEVVGAYLVDASSKGLPTHVRERLRVEGPSIQYIKDPA